MEVKRRTNEKNTMEPIRDAQIYVSPHLTGHAQGWEKPSKFETSITFPKTLIFPLLGYNLPDWEDSDEWRGSM